MSAIQQIALPDKDFKTISQLVYDLAGICLPDTKRELVQARLSKRLRTLNIPSYREYLTFVEEDKAQTELILLLDALSTNLTSFWREAQHFDHLINSALPRIAERARREDGRIRIWSAGCSTGEEPYGLAMILCDELKDANNLDVKILATDLSTRVLAVAKAAVYPENRVKDVPPMLRSRFFVSEKDKSGETFYRVSNEVRSMVAIARLNLMESWPMKGPFDAIFCRNVMIYFDKATQAKLVAKFYDLLRRQGLLYIGHSESLTGVVHGFNYLQPAIYQKP
jgi:chemotaxis protein methyltransferase CheR